MFAYSKEQINELKSKVNYEEFYKKYLPDLQRRGSKLWACCCFHQETKPSLCIDSELGLWRCFGSCNEGGDIFTFYKKYFNLTFPEAVQCIAEMYNYELNISDEERERLNEVNKIYKVNEVVADKAKSMLESDVNAWNYLTKIRGISPKMIEHFKLGRGGNLPKTEGTINAGLIKVNEDGTHYTYLRKDRILFPRFNEYGKILSFTGRLYEEKDTAKYFHLPDTSVYKKSENVYGLYQAKKYIKHFNSVILTEGQLDCIKCHQKGIVNTVALDGLRISDAQINILKKYTNTFYLCIEDGAMLKPNDNNITPLDTIYNKIKSFIPYAKVYIIDLRNKDGSKCDPDMYLSNHTKEDFQDLIKHARIYNEFIINLKLKSLNPKNNEEKNLCIKTLIPMLVNIQNFMDRKSYIELIANKLLFPENNIYKMIKIHNENKDKELNTKNLIWDSRPVYAQKIILSMCFCKNFNNKKVVNIIKNRIEEKMEYLYRQIFRYYIEPYISKSKEEIVDFSNLFSDIKYGNVDKEIQDIILDCYMKTEMLEDFEDEDVEELLEEQLSTLSEYVVYESNELEFVDI